MVMFQFTIVKYGKSIFYCNDFVLVPHDFIENDLVWRWSNLIIFYQVA